MLDRTMPVMDGDHLMKELRRDKWGKNVPVIIISNLTEDMKFKEAYGVVDYIVKSEKSLEEVISIVKEAIENAK